jgi:hypothetical protein
MCDENTLAENEKKKKRRMEEDIIYIDLKVII